MKQPWICPVCNVGCAPTATHCTACEKRQCIPLAPLVPGTAPVIIPITVPVYPSPIIDWPLPLDVGPTVIYTSDTRFSA